MKDKTKITSRRAMLHMGVRSLAGAGLLGTLEQAGAAASHDRALVCIYLFGGEGAWRGGWMDGRMGGRTGLKYILQVRLVNRLLCGGFPGLLPLVNLSLFLGVSSSWPLPRALPRAPLLSYPLS